MTEFKDNLRRMRRDKDITQEKLAKKAKIHQTHVSHFEHGRRKPSFDNLISLAKALDCTIDELVKQG